jgi:hypothetical protein
LIIFSQEKHGRPPKIEEEVSMTYLIDRNKYLFFGGVKHPFNIKDLE